MAKGKWSAIGMVAIIVLYFQNCGQLRPNPSELDFSTASITDEIYDDRNDFDPNMLEKVSTTSVPVMMDRYGVSGRLRQVFGPGADALTQTDIGRNKGDFGSPCSIYEDYNTRTGSGALSSAAPREVCSLDPGPNNLGAPVLPIGSVVRQALMAKVCTNLTLTAATMQFALNQIDSIDPLPSASTENVREALQLFYHHMPAMDVSLVQSLQLLLDPNTPTLEQWQSVLFTICTSSYWQVL